MAFVDNRQFMEALGKSKDLVAIKEEVDWELEAGAIVRRANEMQGPAVLFEKVKDYPPGYHLFGSPLGTYRRLAIAMALGPDTFVKEIHATFEDRMEKPLKPVIVKSAPCKEEILVGEEVDLFRFPVPLIHDGDGGRYIGTWHAVVSKDPDSDWTNWGMYTLMVHDKRHVIPGWRPASDLGNILFGKYVPQGKPMPFAAVIGADPLCSLAAIAALEIGQSEVDYAGGLRQEPVELVKCETSNLLVPANAEIILEGVVFPNIHELSGPFGDHPGYLCHADHRLLCRVDAITHRKNPILTMTCPGIMVYDGNVCSSMCTAITQKKHLRAHGIPVTDVDIPPVVGQHLVVVGVKAVHHSNIAMRIKNALLSRAVWQHKIIVVDDDVDVFNFDEVMHAFATKCHPIRGVRASEEYGVAIITPYLSPEEREWRKGASILFDCTWPVEWSRENDISPRASFNQGYPEQVKNKALEKCRKYGLK